MSLNLKVDTKSVGALLASGRVLKNKTPHVFCSIDSVNFRCIGGDDALWIDTKDGLGYKIIPYSSEEERLQLIFNCNYIKESGSDVFPLIEEVGYDKDKGFVFVKCEKVPDNPTPDEYITRCILEINKLNLCPESAWMKRGYNIIGNKIVDFHRFQQMKGMYEFPTQVSYNDLHDIYARSLSRYKEMGVDKWKGKIYQGMHFSNGYSMDGYSSDGVIFDSYRKLPLCYLDKVKNKNVLDLGCNEGFFSFQSALQGANRVDSVDTCSQDISLAKDIQEVLNVNQIHFHNTKADAFVSKTDQKYEVTFLLSVLHQIYPNMKKGVDKFLRTISKKTKYMIFETPMNHPRMKITRKAVKDKLKKHFKTVRFMHQYDAYSSGYRVLYVCFNG